MRLQFDLNNCNPLSHGRLVRSGYGTRMFGSFLITTVRGVPIRLHYTAIFMLLFFPKETGLLEKLAISALLLFSVALHELGHTIVSQKYGIPVKDILLTPIGGIASLRGMPEDPHHEIRISLAGPYVSLLLAVLGYILLFATAGLRIELLSLLFLYLAGMNTALLCFNLLPSFPMDGGRVLRGWLTTRKGPLEATRIASTLGKYMSIAFIVIGLGTYRFSLALIGFFILSAGKSEYRMMQMKTYHDQTHGGITPPGEADFEASPPPYQQSGQAHQGLKKGLLADIVYTWKDLVTEACRTCFRPS